MSGKPYCPKCKRKQRSSLGVTCERCQGPIYWTQPPPGCVTVDKDGKVVSVVHKNRVAEPMDSAQEGS